MSARDGRTEDPTPQRRRKAREEGQVARSQEVAVAGSFVAMIGVLALLGPSMARSAMGTWSSIIGDADSVAVDGVLGMEALTLFASLAGPFLAAAVLMGLAAGIGQVGVKFNAKLAQPKLKNLDPRKGLDKFKPKTATWELTRTVLKLGAVGAVLAPTLMAWRSHLANDRTLAGAIERLSGAYGAIILRATLLALVIAAADFAFQKYKTEEKLKMKPEDVKRDFKDAEGDPHQKQARRQKQSELSRNRMLGDVATADAVVANPTHLVVALRYDPEEGAPRVVAKGADHLAEKIKDTARRHGVPVSTDVPLARALYRRCKVGQHIPAELYQAVAVVLAAAYRRSGRSPGSRRRQLAGRVA